MGTIKLVLDEDYLKKTRAAAKKRAIEHSDDEAAEHELHYEDLDLDFDEFGFDEDGYISISGNIGDLGWISIEFQPTAEDLLPLIELAVKRLNRFKTMLESLK